MFDPTVFDNLKVAFENNVYDLDNLTGQIHVTNRFDRLEMSNMSREFALQFQLAHQKAVTAEIQLQASLNDLAAEILETPDQIPGCTLILRFYMQVAEVSEQCNRILEVFQDIWKPDLPPSQTLSFVYDQEKEVFTNTIELNFSRKINEDQINDIPNLIEHMLQTLRELSNI